MIAVVVTFLAALLLATTGYLGLAMLGFTEEDSRLMRTMKDVAESALECVGEATLEVAIDATMAVIEAAGQALLHVAGQALGALAEIAVALFDVLCQFLAVLLDLALGLLCCFLP